MNLHLSLTGECPVCSSTNIKVFFEAAEVPIHCNLLWSTRDEAIAAPRGEIRLGFCAECGHVFNIAFNAKLMEYAQSYENSLHFSPRFQNYANNLAARLVDRFSLHDKDVIEIGCGKGDFLRMLCELGGNRGYGFDPSHTREPDSRDHSQRLTFIDDFYSERYASYEADLICCRHALEHIPDPHDFLIMLRRAIGGRSGTVVFFEVPNVLFSLRDLSIWDIIYEHCSFFSSNSLRRAFTESHFDVLGVAEEFGGQFLCIEALPARSSGRPERNGIDDVSGLMRDVEVFGERYRVKVDLWRERLERIERSGQRAVVWGGGSKGVTFLNTLGVRDEISYVVDVNPRKVGMYVAGTGQRIVSPGFLREYRPDVVIVMNASYEDEIRQISAGFGLTAEFILA